MSDDKPTAIAVAKKRAGRKIESEPVILSTGIAARFVPISISIITEAQAAVPDPPMQMWWNESKQVEEENPNHPDYQKAMEKADEQRNLAAVDAIIMFGVELIDGLPEDKSWLKKLLLRHKMGLSNVDLNKFDLEEPIELEFLYKKYIAVSTADVKPLMDSSGLSETEVAEATKSFPDNEERRTDREDTPIELG